MKQMYRGIEYRLVHRERADGRGFEWASIFTLDTMTCIGVSGGTSADAFLGAIAATEQDIDAWLDCA